MYTPKHYFGTEPDEKTLAGFITAMALHETESHIVMSNIASWIVDTLGLPYSYFRHNLACVLMNYTHDNFKDKDNTAAFVEWYKTYATKMMNLIRYIEEFSIHETLQPLGIVADKFPKGHYNPEWVADYQIILDKFKHATLLNAS